MSSKNLTTAQVETILSALRVIHAEVWDFTAEGKENLPARFDELTSDHMQAVCVRALRGIAHNEKVAKDAKAQRVRQSVNALLETAQETARREKAEYDSLSDSLKARIGAFPTFVNVSVDALQGVLGTSNVGNMVKALHELGFKIDGRSIGKAKDIKNIAFPWEATLPR